MRKLLGPGVVFCLFVLVVGSLSAQQPARDSCPESITSCGCVINSTGTYTVANNLSATQTNRPNCIEITADHSILNLKGFQVLGNANGTGIGIWIHRGADHVVVEGSDEGSGQLYAPDTACTPGGSEGIVSRWNVAIEDDADNAVIERFDALGGFAQNPVGNTTAGLLINANHAVAGNLNACFNGVAGVILRQSTGSTLFNMSANSNLEVGVWFDTSNQSDLATATADANGHYGIWLMRSSQNVVNNFDGSANDIGTLVGCGDVHCTGNEGSDENRITSGGNHGNRNAGLVIQKHSHENIVTITTNDGSPNGQDMIDENPHCDSNTWYNNNGTTEEGCIH